MTTTIQPPRGVTAPPAPRPLPVLAPLAGAVAACVPLLGALTLAVIGWFVTDAGSHGVPRDALRAGALAWLSGHGSGLTVEGVRITAVPLGVTLLCVWSVWRSALRLGENVAGHGPDAEALADGDRDWTVPVATGLFACSYLVIITLTGVLASTGAAEPSLGAVIGWSLLLTLVLGGIGIAVGSGRAAVWLPVLPEEVRATVGTSARILLWLLGVSALVFVAALVADLDTAANVLSQMHTDAGDALLFGALMLTIVPNAVLFAGSYLLGPGFLVGTGTLVSPTVVAVGPVPMLPLLAALPDNGPTPAWAPALMALPALVAAIVVFRVQRRRPYLAWDRGALHGLVAGALAGAAFGLLAALSGGAVGPGRMADVGPVVGEVLLTGVVSLGLGGLLGGLLATWLFRRGHEALVAESDHSATED
ncbi:DUF6350 family protein [Nocardioides daejeonensis]|uniref:cell division protein PerM n=1 Tax=Nocardioides daejeonensis TaxID=1046556 RepID=UPI000D74CF77|nr:DUF6350 family protein [Nocardioides daejeonensis]